MDTFMFFPLFDFSLIRDTNKSKHCSDDQLVNVCLDLFLAGMETVSTTLRWAVLYLAKHQSVQV